MKRFKNYISFILLGLFLLIGSVTTCNAQNKDYKVSTDGELVELKAPKQADTQTVYYVKIKQVKYPVYKSKRNKYYIIRTSKKTSNKYKQYINIESNPNIE